MRKHQSRVSVSLKGSICQNLYKNKQKGIANISLNIGLKNVKVLNHRVKPVDQETLCRSDFIILMRFG